MEKFATRNLKIIAKLMIIAMLIFGITPIMPVVEKHYISNAVSKEKSVFEVVYKAVYYHYDKYTTGTPVDAGYGKFGAYEAYILTKAGETVSEWVYNGSNLKEDVIKLMDDTIKNSDKKKKDWTGKEVYAKSSKRAAQEYLAAKEWGEKDRAEALLNILKQRQERNEDGSLDGNPYSDIPAYELLGRAGDIEKIDVSKAIEYILKSQDSSTGAWSNSYNDFMLTAQAVRVLAYLKDYAGSKVNEVENAINSGLKWLKSKQQSDGGFKSSPYDDVAVDTVEVILTLDVLNIDLDSWTSSEGKSPVDYLREKTLNSDGSFGTYRNLVDATWVLDAYLKLYEAVYKAVYYHYDKYTTGTPVDAGYGKFGAYEAYILTKAGETVSEWVYNGSNLKEDVIKLMDDTIKNSDEKKKDWTGKEVYVKSSKRAAQEYLAAKEWGEKDRAEALLNILKQRQERNEDGSLDGNPYSDIPAYELLGRAGDIEKIDVSKAIEYILKSQDSSTGAWSNSYNDFMLTAQAVRALAYLKDYAGSKVNEVENAINSGLKWLKSKQQSDGGFKSSPYDDVAVDTVEVILTLDVLNINLDSWTSSEGKSPVDYLREKTLNSDGSFGTYRNLVDATWVLDAYTRLNLLSVKENDSSDDGENVQPSDSTIKVYIAIIGKDGEIICFPRTVILSKDNKYGLTALGALDAAGVDYRISKEWDGFVEEIEGIRNKGMNGWMYAVNGSIPSVLAADKRVKSSDKILWWYSEDSMGKAPSWPSDNSSSAQTVISKEKAEKIEKKLKEYDKKLSDIKNKTIILKTEKIMDLEKAKKLKEQLDNNKVKLSLKIGKDGGIIADTKVEEVSLLVPERALTKNKNISIEEMNKNSKKPKQYAVKINSSIYEFKPSGIKFDKPVTISIKLPVTKDMNLDRLTPAWYDEENKKWIPISGVIDAEEGIAVFKVNHFTKFAVIEMPKRVFFKDVNENVGWAKDAIEILAGQNIIKGTGNGRYEPQRAITRAEFVNLIVNALNLSSNKDSDIIFKDVKDTDWFSKAVKIAYENNIILGDEEGRFRPNDKITRNEMAAIFYRLNKSDADVKDYKLNIKDKSQIPIWALNGVKYVYKKGLMIGYKDNTFRGDKLFSRAEVAVVIYRYLNDNNN
ncbi:S-layer homology domain-containing protein [Caminicella sporogenes]|uniref:S-layer homology domain-containing protein n=1 Tax=Caminicella sporogenes TaxID=166485 RepID=UPI000E7245A1|nr:S-layer homology domain-containing protein [Caminicella sporogenes]RKD21438.1 hypothetical protein BET04_08345 [Caminicella sporogenes]